MDRTCGLALLCEPPIDLSRHAGLLEELDPDLAGLIIAAGRLEPLLVAAGGGRARLVAALHPEAGLLGALQSALLCCSCAALVAIDASQPTPDITALRRLLDAPHPGNVLVYRRGQEIYPLPGRFRPGCLGPLSRALLEGERQLAPVLRRLHCSTLTL